jgi:hypothetical protein
MARIPTPALPGQEVGSVRGRAVAQPFQNLQTSADMFGAAQGRALQQAGQGLGQLSSDLTAQAKTDDKVDQQKMQAEVNAFAASQKAAINALSGQERLDYIQKGTSGQGAAEDFNSGVSAIVGKYDMRLRSSADVNQIFSTNSATDFGTFISGQEESAKKVVMEQTTTTAMANAVTSAVTASSYNDPVARARGYNEALAAAERLVLDPDIGLAKQAGNNPTSTDPKVKARVDLMVKEAKMQVVDGIVTELLSKGKLDQASTLVENAAATGTGTKTLAAMQAKILPFREKIQAGQDFSALRKSMVKPDGTDATLAEMQLKISQEADPAKRSRLASEFSIYSSAQTAVLNEKVRDQGAILIQAIINENVTPQLLAQVPDYLRVNPTLTQALATGAAQRATAAAKAKTAEAQAHISAGGGASNLPGLEKQMVALFQTNKPQALALIRTGKLKKYFDVDTYEDMTQQAAIAEASISKQESKNPSTPTTVMRNYLGYTATEARAASTKYGVRLTDAVSRVEKAAIAAGKPVNPEDVRKAVVEALIKVRTVDRFAIDPRGDVYTVNAAIEQSKLDEGFDPYKAILSGKAGNTRAVALLFDKAPDQIVKAREEMDDADVDYTLNNLAKHLKVQTPPELRRIAETEQELNNLAVDAGFPPAFIEQFVVEGRKQELNKDTVAEAIKDLKTGKFNGYTVQQLLSAWASQ